MVTLRVAPTRQGHTELLSGILTVTPIIPYCSPNLKREGGLGETQHEKGKQKTRL